MKVDTKLLVLGVIMIILGFIFAIAETRYFGNNLFPNSTAEDMCDLVSMVLVFGGSFIIRSQRK